MKEKEKDSFAEMCIIIGNKCKINGRRHHLAQKALVRRTAKSIVNNLPIPQ